jgi:hypothetical protein
MRSPTLQPISGESRVRPVPLAQLWQLLGEDRVFEEAPDESRSAHPRAPTILARACSCPVILGPPEAGRFRRSDTLPAAPTSNGTPAPPASNIPSSSTSHGRSPITHGRTARLRSLPWQSPLSAASPALPGPTTLKDRRVIPPSPPPPPSGQSRGSRQARASCGAGYDLARKAIPARPPGLCA